MRYGLLALSIVMLTSGGVAAQSALAISHSANAKLAAYPDHEAEHGGIIYGALPFTTARASAGRVAAS